ncbi:MFS transporter [Paenibacillus sp.]
MSFKLSSIGSFAKERARDVWSIVDDALINNEDGHAKGRRGMLFGNYFGALISSMIAGNYFTGLLIHMGASDAYIGYLTLIGSICTFLQLFAPLIVERFDRRKNILMVGRGIMHFLNIVFVGIVPILPISQTARLTIFMLTMITINLINSFSGSGFNVWHMQSVPLPRRASYFTLSSLGVQVISVATGFCAGLAVDGIEGAELSVFGLSPKYFAFLLLRLIALLLVIGEFKCFFDIPEHPYEKDAKTEKIGLGLLFLPLKNKGFMMMALIVFIWNVLAGFIGSYYNVYLQKQLQLSYTYLSLAGLMGLPMTIIFTPIWAKLINKHSWLKMFAVALGGYMITFLLNTVTTATTQFIYIISNIVCYIFNPAISLNFSNIQFVKMPPTNQTAFCSFYSAFVTLGTILGNSIGNGFFGLTEGMSFDLFGLPITNYQWMCLVQLMFAFILLVYVIIVRAKLRRDPANSSLNL